MAVTRWLRIAAGVAILVAIALTVGGAPFLRGLRSVTLLPILVALLMTAVATAAAAWRWRTVAGALGIELGWWGAVRAYYRSQFLNTVLPGGVVGDIHRAYRHGRDEGDVALAARAVVTERVSGQLVQFVLVVVALALVGLTSPLGALAWVAAAAVGVVALAVGIVAATARGRRLLLREARMLAPVFRSGPRLLRIALASALVAAAHTTVFVVACLAVGAHAAPGILVAVALVTLTAAALPLNIGGWGPREGAAGATFAALGLGGSAGVAASTTFGVVSTIALIPGLAVLVVEAVRARRREATALEVHA